MKLRNISRRLITINGALSKSDNGKFSCEKCVLPLPKVRGKAAEAVDVPDSVVESSKKFINALIEAGDVEVLADDKRTDVDDEGEYAGVSNDDLKELLSAGEIEIEGRFSRKKAIEALQGA